ncbi:MAG: proline iminopeptidase-family hydrolase [Candidatus Binataceae bacterium]
MAVRNRRPGRRIREGRLAVAGGRVWYRVVGRGGGTPLITLHGGPGATHNYLEPLEELADERPVVLYDQLGCGKSDRPDNPKLWHIDRFVAELAAVRRSLGLARVHILGQSWGTLLLAKYALSKPRGLASVIFSNPAISIPRFRADCARLIRALPPRVRKTIAEHERTGRTGCPEYPAAAFEFYRRHLCRLDPWPEALERSFAGMGQQVYETMNGPNEFTIIGNIRNLDYTRRLRELRAIPALFMAGRFDETTPEATRECQRNLPGSEMVIFEKSSHMPMFEERARYLGVVREFLRRADRGAS